MPLMVGTVSTFSGSLRFGFLVPLFGTILMLGFYVLRARELTILDPLVPDELRKA